MRLWFFGAARTVTGSMHLLEAAGKRILLDCGLFQGHRQEAFERNRSFPFAPSQVDCLILSHAHIDHSGNIPTLVKQGFRGDIYATFATRDLCGAMLLDSAHIQEQDAEYVNRRKKPHERVAPLYGGRVRHPAEDIERELEEVIVRAAGRGGKVTIPARGEWVDLLEGGKQPCPNAPSPVLASSSARRAAMRSRARDGGKKRRSGC